MNSPKTAKEYLQQLQWMDTVINQKLQELANLRARSKSVGSFDYSKEKVQTSPYGKSPFADLVERVVTLEDAINDGIDVYEKEKHRIIEQIQGLKNIKYINVLYKRYVEFKSFKIIADEMHYTYQYILNLHNHALKEFQKSYKKL